MQDVSLADRIARELEAAGILVDVEESDGTIQLNGIVDTAEARVAAEDIAASVARERPIENNLDVETVLPTSVADFTSASATADLEASDAVLVTGGDQLAGDFIDQPLLFDPVEAPGASSSNVDDPADEWNEVYTPPSDPVVASDERGRTHVLGGFELDAMAAIDVEPSASDAQPGDEALADAIRRELSEDAATADLPIHVVVRRGIAHLRGRVAGPEDAENAEEVASRVPGVREVVEELEVAGL